MMYVKSTITGQVYEMPFLPKFGGFELSTKEEFDKWNQEHGIKA